MKKRRSKAMVVGVLSDTHGLLRTEAVQAFAGVELIIHAGDVGREEIIAGLREIAPVFVVRGNIDTGPWADQLPLSQTVPAGGHNFYVLHDISALATDSVKASVSAVIFGHSHKPSIGWRDGVLYLNPGSAGPRRFALPICVARVRISGKRIEPEIIALDTRRAP
jgi:putative phosphoesterase